MTNILKLDHSNSNIVMDRTFAKKAEIVGSREYLLLQDCRRDYPFYTVIRRTINKKPDQEHYRGLTYEYMENYINSHENKEENLKTFSEMINISKCHSACKRYPVIKQWFLATYPDIAEFGKKKEKENAENSVAENIVKNEETADNSVAENNIIEADFTENVEKVG